MLDIRKPIGLMFLLMGGVLTLYGMTTGPASYRICLGYNINLLWGLTMTAFGFAMVGWMRLAPQRRVPDEGTTAEPGTASAS